MDEHNTSPWSDEEELRPELSGDYYMQYTHVKYQTINILKCYGKGQNKYKCKLKELLNDKLYLFV